MNKVIHTGSKYTFKKIVQCPEAGQSAQIILENPRASFPYMLKKKALRVANCSLWPKRKGCIQNCIDREVRRLP